MEYLKQGDSELRNNTVPKSRKITLHHFKVYPWGFFIKVKHRLFYNNIPIHFIKDNTKLIVWYNPGYKNQGHLDERLMIYLLKKQIPFIYRKNGTQGMRLEIPSEYLIIKP